MATAFEVKFHWREVHAAMRPSLNSFHIGTPGAHNDVVPEVLWVGFNLSFGEDLDEAYERFIDICSGYRGAPDVPVVEVTVHTISGMWYREPRRFFAVQCANDTSTSHDEPEDDAQEPDEDLHFRLIESPVHTFDALLRIHDLDDLEDAPRFDTIEDFVDYALDEVREC